MPPLPLTVMLPVDPPLQSTFTVLVELTLSVVGWFIVSEIVFVHPLASLIVTLYTPADKLEKVLDEPNVPPLIV